MDPRRSRLPPVCLLLLDARPSAYTCQVNIIDSIASAVAFPRVSFVVMD